MRAFTMSKSALLLSPCIRWAGEGVSLYKDEFANTEKRDLGILFHARMDLYAKTGVAALALDGLPDKVRNWVELAIAWFDNHLKPRCSTIHSEVYVAYNFATNEVHVDPAVLNREYPDKPGYVPGTADLVCVLHDGSLLVMDWKTGGSHGADAQLLSLALGLREVYLPGEGSRREVRLAIVRVTDEAILPQEWAPGASEMMEHRLAMSMQIQDIGQRCEPVPGPHCTQLYCPHLASCPGISGVVEEAAAEDKTRSDLLPAANLMRRYSITEEPSSPEQAGHIMALVTAAKRQVDYYEKRIRRYCEDGGKCISGQYEYSKGRDGYRWRTK